MFVFLRYPYACLSHSMPLPSILRFRLLAAALVLSLTGCGKSSGPSGGGPPPQDVSVVTLKPQRVTLITDLPGRTSPYRIADVRPQVNGIILKRMFEEGSEVQEGQQLYQIDPAPYQAAYDSAQATLDHANAALTTAKLLADRDQGLVASNAVSKQDYDNAMATMLQAKADVASAQAAVETAHVNLVYTRVLSPITGITGRSITEGALVTINQTTPMVTVQQLDPIYVDIPQSVSTLLRLKQDLAKGQIANSGNDQAPVTLTLEDGSAYSDEGHIQFSEVTVDQGTGSVILRAVFPNTSNILLPGMFVTAHLQDGIIDNAIMAPQQGITHDPLGHATALVVAADNIVELRVVTASRAIGDKWLVTDGLHAGDKVIVEGIQKVKPGATVHPTEVSPDDTAAAPHQ
jgi:membrane fusion protein (multidrug efflux system)